MNYQRVLIADKFTAEIKSKLRIVSFQKRRSWKRNVYHVKFSSNADMKYADQACKRLCDVTLQPFRLSSSKAQHKHQISISNNQKNVPSSTIVPLSSPISLLSPSTNLSFLADCHSTFIPSQSSPLRKENETLEERAMRLLGPLIATRTDVTPISTVQPLNLISSGPDVSLIESPIFSNVKDKEQLIESVHSCLRAMETARLVADEVCQLYRDGSNCRTILDQLVQVHSTAFYLKASLSAQIKAPLSSGRRLSWPGLANDINAFRTDVGHQQLFMAQIASAKHVLSKIDSTASIAMSSKLAYQLTKLSH